MSRKITAAPLANKTKAPALYAKLAAPTRGSKFGAIIDAAYGQERDAIPRFAGRATATSDGFLMCHFVDRNGEGHMGAFVGSLSDLQRNVAGLSDHLNLSAAERAEFRTAISAWVGPV